MIKALLGSAGNLLLEGEARAAEGGRPKNGEEALALLMDGNKRFVNSRKKGYMRRTPERREEVAQ